MAAARRSSSNPALSDEAFARVTERDAGWAAATLQQVEAGAPVSPHGPVVGTDSMSVRGTVWATAALLVLVVGAGVFGWNSVEVTEGSVRFPGWLFLPLLGAVGVAFVTIFKPALARFTAPVYALLEGVVLGAISGLYDAVWNGIVLQAVCLTIGVFAVMLFLYGTRIIKVTDRLRMGIIGATGAIFLVYLVNMVLSLFGASIPFLHDSGPVGILISLVIVAVAAFNLLLDFDFVERGVAAGAPRQTEWYAAFGLLVTLVWLYLEVLRLLAILQGRD
jgi:uncharacterized YccA/Bax inhibitor family protein